MLVHILIYLGPEVIFCAFAQFFAGIGPAHFPAETTRPLGRGCLPFSPSFSRCKVTKRKFGNVTFCHYLSPFSELLFHAAKLRKRILALSAFVRICPEMSAFVRISFSLQSYEKKNWHCPAMSSYVHLCPFMSSYDIASSRNLRCKVTKSKIGTVQICPIMSKFVHLIL